MGSQTTSAIEYLKGLDESISDNKLLLQQASSAWRAQKSRKDNKQINISISENSYNIAVQLAKSNGYSIKAMVDFLIVESQNKIEELERLKKVESEYEQACKTIGEQDTQIEDLDDELLALKKHNDVLEQGLVSLKQDLPLAKPLVLAKKSESSALRSNRKEVRKKRTYAK